MILTWTILEKFYQKPPESAFSSVFFRDNFRLEVVGYVVSGVEVEHVDMDIHVKCGDSRSNSSRDIWAAHFVMVNAGERRWTQVIR